MGCLPAYMGRGFPFSKVEVLFHPESGKWLLEAAIFGKHSEHITFITPTGPFEYVRMPFTLTNDPATFHHLIKMPGITEFQVLIDLSR